MGSSPALIPRSASTPTRSVWHWTPPECTRRCADPKDVWCRQALAEGHHAGDEGEPPLWGGGPQRPLVKQTWWDWRFFKSVLQYIDVLCRWANLQCQTTSFVFQPHFWSRFDGPSKHLNSLDVSRYIYIYIYYNYNIYVYMVLC